MEILNQDIEKKMKEILELRPNWNGEGSKTYNEETFVIKEDKMKIIHLV